MKSYRSSLTFLLVNLLFQELFPLVQNFISPIFFFDMLSDINMKVGSKLMYEELQIKFKTLKIKNKTLTRATSWTEQLYLFLIQKVQRNIGCRSEFVGAGVGPVLL